MQFLIINFCGFTKTINYSSYSVYFIRNKLQILHYYNIFIQIVDKYKAAYMYVCI